MWANKTYTFSPSTTAKSGEVNQNFDDMVDGLDTAMPSGGIIIWSGSTGTIPTGWYLCDGNNSTPDLRGRFIVGAGGSYAVGNTGGEASHVLTTAELANHNHTVNPPATNTNNDTHTHSTSGSDVCGTLSNLFQSGAGSAYTPSGEIAEITIGSDTHNHSVDIAQFNSGTAGSGNAHENRPPYYALAYIMKS